MLPNPERGCFRHNFIIVKNHRGASRGGRKRQPSQRQQRKRQQQQERGSKREWLHMLRKNEGLYKSIGQEIEKILCEKFSKIT